MDRTPRVLRFLDGELALDRAVVMGIVNVTPDSFSDGGRFLDPGLAVTHALRLADEGAAILDVGGESTRPGANPVPAEEEWRRVEPVLAVLRAKTDAWISIDTHKPAIAAKAIGLGADMVNDVRGLRDPEMVRVVATAKTAAVVMHMKGEPKTMQQGAAYEDVVGEVAAFLESRTRLAVEAGIAANSIVIDPGLGFGKRPEHNSEVLRRLGEFRRLGFPILVGASGKRFADEVGGGAERRLERSLAAAVLAVENGADLIRVHDVAATAKAIRAADPMARGSR